MSMNGIDFCEVVTFVNDPEPRISQAGGAWMTCRAAYNPRVKNRQTNAYEDGETTWIGLKAFKQTSDMIVATFHKGDKALVKGTLTTERYTDNAGVERDSLVLVVDEIGASPRFATVTITRNQGAGGTQQPQSGAWTGGAGQSSPQPEFGAPGAFGEPPASGFPSEPF